MCALVGTRFKAADADKDDATARLFPSPLAVAALPGSLPRKQTQSGKLNI